GWFVFWSGTSPPGTSRSKMFAITLVKGLLVALAVVSLVGMPTLSAAVAITFWTLAFWYAALVEVPTTTVESNHPVIYAPSPQRLSRWTWLVIWTIAVTSVAGTAYTARHRLRIPQLAVDVGFPYYYGFSEPERVDLGKPSSVWTGRHAVAVLTPDTR